MSDLDIPESVQLYGCLGLIVGIVVFLGGWWYAVDRYGWFLGLGLGWVPSLCIGIFAGALWPVVVAGVLYVFYKGQGFPILGPWS